MAFKFLSKADAKWLTDWTNDKWDEQRAKNEAYADIFIRFGQENSDPDDPATFKKEFEAAAAGDTTLFEMDYPEHAARFFPTPAKLGRIRDDKVWAAARYVKWIRLFWKANREFLELKIVVGGGRETITAEKIAADRYGVKEKAVENRLKKL